MLKNKKNRVRFVFREASNRKDLLELLRLRYRVYRNSRLSRFVNENEYGFDLDGYDLRARHFGLFLHDKNIIKALGYQRGIINQFGPLKDEILEISELYPNLSDKLNLKPKAPFPCLTFLPQSEKNIIMKFYNRISSKGESMTESTRFLLDSSVRSFRLASLMAEAVVGSYMFRHEYGITCVNETHLPFYKRLGFNHFEGTKSKCFSVNNNNLACLYISKKSISPVLYNRFLKLARFYESHGQILLYPGLTNDDKHTSHLVKYPKAAIAAA